MVKSIKIPVEELANVLNYDSQTGKITWKESITSRAKAGDLAGVWLKMHNGRSYLSITYRNRKMSAAQVAWALHNNEWPDRSIFYADGDPTNLKISNLKLATHKSIKVMKEDGSVGYQMTKDQQRHYGLMRYYGLSIAEYSEMYRLQDGKCAICRQPELSKDRHGNSRILAVDHCHETGVVRELLCYSCNSMLGQAKDRADVLLAGAKYLHRHSKDNSPILVQGQCVTVGSPASDDPVIK